MCVDIEEKAKAMRRYCEERRQIVALMPIVREVIRKFDGKVYNKRFNTALASAVEAKHGKSFYIHVELSISREWLWISAGVTGHWSSSVSLCGCQLDEGKRIPAAKMLESCNTKYAEVLQESSEIEQAVDRMPDIIAQLGELHRLQEQIKASVPRHMAIEYRLSDICKWGL